MTWSECRELATKLSSAGIACFPIGIGFNHDKGKTEKRPLTPHGHNDATTDQGDLNELFKRHVKLGPGEWPGVGAYPGPSGLLVIDVDDLDALSGLEASHGTIEGRRVRTASGGLHIWSQLPEGVTIGQRSPWPGIDIRSSKGWVVAPGVRTPWGEWTPESGDLDVPAPRWVLDALTAAEVYKTPTLVASNGEKIPEGSRNAALFSEARSMNRRGWSLDATTAALHVYNETYCDPPHSASEVERAARSAYERYEQGRPTSANVEVPDQDPRTVPSTHQGERAGGAGRRPARHLTTPGNGSGDIGTRSLVRESCVAPMHHQIQPRFGRPLEDLPRESHHIVATARAIALLHPVREVLEVLIEE